MNSNLIVEFHNTLFIISPTLMFNSGNTTILQPIFQT